MILSILFLCIIVLQVNLDMTDSTGPGKLVRHMQNPSYTYDEYLICIGLGQSILSVICKDPSYSGPSYPSSPVYYITSMFNYRIIIKLAGDQDHYSKYIFIHTTYHFMPIPEECCFLTHSCMYLLDLLDQFRLDLSYILEMKH